MYKVTIENNAAKHLSKLDAKSYRLVSESIKKLSLFRQVSNADVKPLKGKFANMFRLRVGSRRILFTADDTKRKIRVWIVENRGDIY